MRDVNRVLSLMVWLTAGQSSTGDNLTHRENVLRPAQALSTLPLSPSGKLVEFARQESSASFYLRQWYSPGITSIS